MTKLLYFTDFGDELEGETADGKKVVAFLENGHLFFGTGNTFRRAVGNAQDQFYWNPKTHGEFCVSNVMDTLGMEWESLK